MNVSAQAPDLMEFGPFNLVLPTEGRRLTPRAWADVGMALLLNAGGHVDAALDLVAGVERRLGVNEAHRRAAATSVEQVHREMREARLRQRLEQNHRAAAAGAPIRDPALADGIAKALLTAAEIRTQMAQLRAADPRKNRRAVRDLEKKAKAWENKALELRAKELDQNRLFGEAREQILLGRARGEDIDAEERETAEIARDEHGARILERKKGPRGVSYLVPAIVYGRGLRAKKLTGIEHAFSSGYLDGGRGRGEALYQAGQHYSEAYEVDEGKTSSGGEGAGGFGPKGPQLRQVEAGETLAIMRRGMTVRERQVLDLICGESLRARDAATRLRAGFPSVERALRGGLRRASENWGAACQAGEAGVAAERVARGARMLKRVRV